MSTRNAEWIRHQAEVQKQADAEKAERLSVQQAVQIQEKLKSLLTELVRYGAVQRGRTQRLAVWHAERCMRVRELLKQLRAEWERAEAAEATVAELRAQLDVLKSVKERG